MDLDELKEAITVSEPSQFCRNVLFDDRMWYFESGLSEVLPGATYEKFRRLVADKVGVTASDVALGGSSKFGFSLNPDERQNKLFKTFDEHSDLDLVIVAPEIFELLPICWTGSGVN